MKGKKKASYMKAVYLQFLTVLMIAAVCINVLLIGYYTYREKKLIRDEKENQLNQSMFYIQRIMEEADTVAAGIWSGTEVQGLLKSYKTKPDYLLYRDCVDYLSNTVFNVNAVAWVDLYLSDSNNLITSNDGVFYGLEKEDQEYYVTLMEETDGPYWSTDYTDHFLSYFHRNKQVVTLMRPVYSTLTGKKKGILCAGIPVNELYNYLEHEGENQGMMIAFGEGNMLPFHMDQEHFALWEGEGGIEKQMEEGARQPYRYLFNGKRYSVLGKKDGKTGMTVYYYYEDRYLLPNLFPVAVCTIAVILLFAAVYRIIIRISDKKMSQPVVVLMDAMKEMEKGTFGVRISEERNDVFGEIFQGFNHMSGNLQRLVREVLEERLRKEDFKYRLLQSQINPHFLYNIFNNMIWMSEQKDYDGLESMVCATAGYYKTALNYGNQDICLSDNLKQLQCYVWIQQVRFADQFECEICFEKEILPLCIPNLLLQPLVENAIAHGAQYKAGITEIAVTGELRGERLHFEVWDNGQGIQENRLNEIREAMKSGNGDGKDYFALVNIARRLEIRYHGRASISIDSVYGEWTKVVLEMQESENV